MLQWLSLYFAPKGDFFTRILILNVILHEEKLQRSSQ